MRRWGKWHNQRICCHKIQGNRAGFLQISLNRAMNFLMDFFTVTVTFIKKIRIMIYERKLTTKTKYCWNLKFQITKIVIKTFGMSKMLLYFLHQTFIKIMIRLPNSKNTNNMKISPSKYKRQEQNKLFRCGFLHKNKSQNYPNQKL